MKLILIVGSLLLSVLRVCELYGNKLMAWAKEAVTTSATDWPEGSTASGSWEKTLTFRATTAIAGYAIAGLMVAGRTLDWTED